MMQMTKSNHWNPYQQMQSLEGRGEEMKKKHLQQQKMSIYS